MAEVNTETARTSDPTLRDLVVPLFRRKRLIVLTFSGVLLGAGFAAWFASFMHQASMEILVNHERLDAVVTPESTQSAGPPGPVGDTQVNSEIELLKSPDLLEQVVRTNHLDNAERKSLISNIIHGKQSDDWYVARAIEHLTSKLDIKEVTKTSMIQVKYTVADPKLAYNVLNSLANHYLDKHLAVHRPPGAYVFFNSEAQKYQQALQESEARLADFSKTWGDSGADLQRTDMAQEVVHSIAALHDVQEKIAADKERIQDQEARLKITPDRSPTAQVTDSAQSLLQSLQSELLQAEIKKTQLTLKFDPSYPLVQEVEQEIGQIEAAIGNAEKLHYMNQSTDRDPTYELIREDIVKTRADMASHQASAAAIGDSIHSLQKKMVDLDQQALMQADLTRDVKTNEANYLLYVSKREQERTSDALDEKRIGNVAIAVPPVLPILPWISPTLVMLIGVVLAVFVSAGSAFIAEYLNPSLRTPTEVLEILRIPVLASVPKQSA